VLAREDRQTTISIRERSSAFVLKTHPFIPTSRRLIIVPLGGGGAAALEDARFRGIAIQRALPAGSVANDRQRARALTPNATGLFVGEREASL
jgi:hypothetical protein